MAADHLRSTLTKGNLWLYVLSSLRDGPASPREIEVDVESTFGFSPAKITFYAVLYKLRREGLVGKATESFRSKYEITASGERALDEAIDALENASERLKRHKD